MFYGGTIFCRESDKSLTLPLKFNLGIPFVWDRWHNRLWLHRRLPKWVLFEDLLHLFWSCSVQLRKEWLLDRVAWLFLHFLLLWRWASCWGWVHVRCCLIWCQRCIRGVGSKVYHWRWLLYRGKYQCFRIRKVLHEDRWLKRRTIYFDSALRWSFFLCSESLWRLLSFFVLMVNLCFRILPNLSIVWYTIEGAQRYPFILQAWRSLRLLFRWWVSLVLFCFWVGCRWGWRRLWWELWVCWVCSRGVWAIWRTWFNNNKPELIMVLLIHREYPGFLSLTSNGRGLLEYSSFTSNCLEIMNVWEWIW